MPLTKEKKEEIIKKFGTNDKDTGTTEVQVALLTAHIIELTEHIKANKKDHHSKRGLFKLVGKRKRLLAYLAKTQIQRYRKLIEELGLRK